MKIYAYYFKNDSGDEFLELEQSDHEMTVVEAMKKFDWWDDFDGWINEGYKWDEIPYCTFMVESIELPISKYKLEFHNEFYVVTRSEEHSDYVEKAFVNLNKAEEYCDKFNNDENSYHRDITKVSVE